MLSYVKGEKKLKFRFDNKFKPMFVLLLFWLVEELTEDFVYGPFFDRLKDISFLKINVEYKIVVFITVLILNQIWLKQRVYWQYSIKKFYNKNIILLLVLVYFMVTPLFSHPERFKEAVIIGIIAAIPEEYLYRGIILGNLLRSTSFIKSRGKRVIITLVISSFVFSLAHVSNILTQTASVTLFKVIQVLGYGAILGAMYMSTGSLFFSIAIHFMIDFSVTIVNGNASTANGPFMMGLVDALIVLVLCIIIAMGIVQDEKKLIICDKIDCGE